MPAAPEGRTPRSAPAPLGPGERPAALWVAALLCLALAGGVAVGTATIGDLSRHGGSRPGGALIAVLLLTLAVGLWQRRYWAALAFQALLVLQLLVATISLVLANGATALAVSCGSIVVGGLLFYKFVPVLGRIQATAIAARKPKGEELEGGGAGATRLAQSGTNQPQSGS